MENTYGQPFYASLNGTMPKTGARVLNTSRLIEGKVLKVQEGSYETIEIVVDYGVQGIQKLSFWDNVVFWNPLPNDTKSGC